MAGASSCPFCALAPSRVVASNVTALAFLDGFPVSTCHTLIVPRRHVESIFDLDEDELADLWALVCEVRDRYADTIEPDGFNIGVNDGNAAGQTVGHGHVHLIPRHKGDVDDPRGGVRWVIPSKAAYWKGR